MDSLFNGSVEWNISANTWNQRSLHLLKHPYFYTEKLKETKFSHQTVLVLRAYCNMDGLKKLIQDEKKIIWKKRKCFPRRYVHVVLQKKYICSTKRQIVAFRSARYASWYLYAPHPPRKHLRLSYPNQQQALGSWFSWEWCNCSSSCLNRSKSDWLIVPCAIADVIEVIQRVIRSDVTWPFFTWEKMKLSRWLEKACDRLDRSALSWLVPSLFSCEAGTARMYRFTFGGKSRSIKGTALLLWSLKSYLYLGNFVCILLIPLEGTCNIRSELSTSTIAFSKRAGWSARIQNTTQISLVCIENPG